MVRNEHLYLCELLYLIHLWQYLHFLLNPPQYHSILHIAFLATILDIASDIATLILLLANFDNY